MSTNHVELSYMGLKILLAVIWLYLPESFVWPRLLVATLVPLLLFSLHNVFYPFYDLFLTRLKCGVYLGTFLTGLVALIAGNSGSSFVQTLGLAVVMFCLFCVGFFLGFTTTGQLYVWRQSGLRRLVRNLAQDNYRDLTWSVCQRVFKLKSNVELAARFSTHHLVGRRQPNADQFTEIASIFLVSYFHSRKDFLNIPMINI